MPGSYSELIENLAAAFDTALAEITAVHNIDYGDEFEMAICRLLRRALPQKFGVCRGYVINVDGQTAGDDVLIYDQFRFPTARLLGEDLSRKQQIPVEAVYAYIEAKHGLAVDGTEKERGSIGFALSQTKRVRELCETRAPVPLTEVAQGVTFTSGPTLSVTAPEGWPTIRNPMYTAIFARRVLDKPGGKELTEPQLIKARLDSRIASLADPIHTNVIVAGTNNVLFSYDPTTKRVRPFCAENQNAYWSATVNGTAFAFGLGHLLWALDYVYLGKMPWGRILGSQLS